MILGLEATNVHLLFGIHHHRFNGCFPDEPGLAGFHLVSSSTCFGTEPVGEG